MARSVKKGPYISEELLQKVKEAKPGTREVFKTWCRSCTVTPEMIGFTFGVHNGKQHIPVFISEDMVGHRLGEFAPTTKFSRHGGRMQREIESKEVAKEAAKTTQQETPTTEKNNKDKH